MPPTHDHRLEIRVLPHDKERFRRAAEARGMSLTCFVIDALSRAADEQFALRDRSCRRSLGWAAGTATERTEIVSPATELSEWAAYSP